MTKQLPKKQLISIAVLAVIGALLAVLILLPKKSAAPAGPDHQPGPAAISHAAGAEPQQVLLGAAQIQAAGIAIAVAAPAAIAVTTTMPGEIRFNEDRTAHVAPKLAGVVASVSAQLGQHVKQGQVLAVITSMGLSEQRSELLTAQRRLALARSTHQREKKLWEDKISAQQDYLLAGQALSEAEIAVQNAQQKLSAIGAAAVDAADGGALNRYQIRAPLDGVVMEKHITQGEAVKEDASVFTISDLAVVWADIAVAPKDLQLVGVGQTVTVSASAFDARSTGKIIYVGALLGEQTRTAKARVALDNPGLVWRPGLFVNVEVQANRVEAPVTVATEAILTVEGWPVVFAKVAGGFAALPVTPGRSDGKFTEILQGLAPGTPYAAAGAFVLKAQLGKSSAGHEH